MNLAGTIARTLIDHGERNVDALRDALAQVDADWAGTKPDEAVGRLNFPLLLDRLVPRKHAELAETGEAGLIGTSDPELEAIIASIPDGPGPLGQAWMEAIQLSDSAWVWYPQTADPSPRVMTWLVQPERPSVWRLIALDLGINAATGEFQMPLAVDLGGCTPGFDESHGTLQQVCLEGGCTHPCLDQWKYRSGQLVLVACDC